MISDMGGIVERIISIFIMYLYPLYNTGISYFYFILKNVKTQFEEISKYITQISYILGMAFYH